MDLYRDVDGCGWMSICMWMDVDGCAYAWGWMWMDAYMDMDDTTVQETVVLSTLLRGLDLNGSAADCAATTDVELRPSSRWREFICAVLPHLRPGARITGYCASAAALGPSAKLPLSQGTPRTWCHPGAQRRGRLPSWWRQRRRR